MGIYLDIEEGHTPQDVLAACRMIRGVALAQMVPARPRWPKTQAALAHVLPDATVRLPEHVVSHLGYGGVTFLTVSKRKVIMMPDDEAIEEGLTL